MTNFTEAVINRIECNRISRLFTNMTGFDRFSLCLLLNSSTLPIRRFGCGRGGSGFEAALPDDT